MSRPPRECPVCDGYGTNREWMEEFHDHISVVRTCDCGTQFTVRYGAPEKEIDVRGDVDGGGDGV